MVLHCSLFLNFDLKTFISVYSVGILYSLKLCISIFIYDSGSMGSSSHWFIIGLHNGAEDILSHIVIDGFMYITQL